MHTVVVIPYLPRAEHTLLGWTLEGYAAQELAQGHGVHVFVGIDGDLRGTAVPLPANSDTIQFSCHGFEHSGAAAVRNRLMALAQRDTSVVVFGNADARPDPSMVQAHADTMARLPARSLVLGAAPWERTVDPSVFDMLIDHAPMVFSYCHMVPHGIYPFRCAYTLNLSARYEDCMAVGGFHDELRPVYYEDLAFGCRLLGPERKGIVFEPAAKVLHRHPLSLDEYLDREELLGIMAPVLARVCPEAFAMLMANRSLDQIAVEFRQRGTAETSILMGLYDHFRELETVSGRTLGDGDQRSHNILRLYKLHLPLKLLAFRLGLLRGMELRDDAHWKQRRPQGLWQTALSTSPPRANELS